MPEVLQPHVVIEDIRVQPLLNAADVARILKVSETTAYRIFDSGEIKTVALGRAVRVTVDALEAYIELKSVGPLKTSDFSQKSEVSKKGVSDRLALVPARRRA